MGFFTELAFYFIAFLGGIFLIIFLLSYIIINKSEKSYDILEKTLEERGIDSSNYCLYGGTVRNGFRHKCIFIRKDYEEVILAKERKDKSYELELINPNQVIEFNIKDVGGKTITQMTGGGTAVTVLGGLAFGGIGALVASSAAQRETKTTESKSVIFEVIYKGGKDPYFSFNYTCFDYKTLEESTDDINARMKIVLSNKSDK